MGIASEVKQRNFAVDILKTIAIIGVITIHVSGGGYANTIGSFNWISAVFWSSITRASVPIFLMCSGALLLAPEKQMTLGKLFTKSLIRIIAALFFWALLYKIYALIASGNLYNAQEWIKSLKDLLLFRHETHLYYLHIIILVYVFLPITRILTTYATKQQLEYVLIIWFVLGILYPAAKSFWPFTLISGIPLQWSINMAYASIGYGILGFYLNKYNLNKTEIYIALWCLGFLIIFGITVRMSILGNILYQKAFEGMSPGVALMAIGLFGSAVSLTKNADEENPIISKISKASFCIYLVHMFFIKIFTHFGFTVDILPTLISIPILVGANFFFSYAAYKVLSKIPIVNKYLI